MFALLFGQIGRGGKNGASSEAVNVTTFFSVTEDAFGKYLITFGYLYNLYLSTDEVHGLYLDSANETSTGISKGSSLPNGNSKSLGTSHVILSSPTTVAFTPL
jgi:hypothetical protein